MGTLKIIHDFLTRCGGGDWASAIGVIIALVGFAITIWNVQRSKTAAERAEEIVRKVRKDSVRIDTVHDCTMAMNLMDQIRLLNRQNMLLLLPEKYSNLRNLLVSIKKTNQDLTESQQTALQSAIQSLRGFERQVEDALAGVGLLDVPRLNTLIAKKIDSLHEVLVEIRSDIGR